jgi:MarR family 2-MHQ and catechol resistance regulon transcriptional repressor
MVYSTAAMGTNRIHDKAAASSILMSIGIVSMQLEKNTTECPSGTDIWLVLMKAFHAMETVAEAAICETGLGNSDFRVLEALLHKGGMAVNELGPKVFLTPGSISVAVERLHAHGLVTRTEDRRDRRVRRVDLTTQGRKLIEAAFRQHAERINALAEPLEPKARRKLVEALKVLGKNAARVSRQ